VTGTTQEVKKGSNNSDDLWLFRLDPNGAIVWQKAFPTKGLQFGKHLHPISGGGAVVLVSGTPDGSPPGAWVLRVNAEGETTGGGWQRVFSSDRPIRVTGYSLHTLMNHTMPTGYNGAKLFLAHLKPNGDFEWQRTYDAGDWGHENLYEVQMVGQDGFVVAGNIGGGIPPGYQLH
jgi:hypothetical protein